MDGSFVAVSDQSEFRGLPDRRVDLYHLFAVAFITILAVGIGGMGHKIIEQYVKILVLLDFQAVLDGLQRTDESLDMFSGFIKRIAPIYG